MTAAQAAIDRWFRAALERVDPERAVERAIRRDGRRLLVEGHGLDLSGRIWIVAVGKAAVPMARAAARVCGPLVGGGVVITKDGHIREDLPLELEPFEAAHPLPDERGVVATCRALEVLGKAGDADLVLALISGGGSALLEAPRPPVTLAEMSSMTDLLLKAGAPIQDLNAVRIPLSLVKGGGLRRAAPQTRFVTLILSDVLGNDPRVIASGPTVAGGADPRRALELLDHYRVRDSVPRTIVAALRNAESDATEAPEQRDDRIVIIGDNDGALDGMRAAARQDGLRVEIVWREQGGEARELGKAWVEACRSAPADVDVLLGGGEATVTVRGAGVGGRNTEFALAAALELGRSGEMGWAVASLATDGQDGPTGVAGTVADGETVTRAKAAEVDPERSLAENDSLSVFAAAGGIVASGPTGTNVNDLYVGVRLASLARIDGAARG